MYWYACYLTKIQDTRFTIASCMVGTDIKYATISQRRYSSQNALYAFSIRVVSLFYTGAYLFHSIFGVVHRMDTAISSLRKTAEKHMRLVQCIYIFTFNICVCIFAFSFQRQYGAFVFLLLSSLFLLRVLCCCCGFFLLLFLVYVCVRFFRVLLL